MDNHDRGLPSWDGEMSGFEAFSMNCRLELDGARKDDAPLLAPRLARRLTDKVFDVVAQLDRAALKEVDGVENLLKALEEHKGKEKIDDLGDCFTEMLQQKNYVRREGESAQETHFEVCTLGEKSWRPIVGTN